MRILKLSTTLGVTLFAILAAAKTQAQTVTQDPKFEELLNDKRKISSQITLNDKYKVQIFYGDNEKARKTMQEFKKAFPETDGTIIFESPTYKVLVGSYASRIDAERALEEIHKKYPYALVVQPNK
ncbi:sporulation protein [Flavobacterium akiainvivens]|uniref:Sporulation protein n=1 Tax=Flavobacterium akiainvivens TaxID=1202724 RepID=A0A0M8MKX9_9FLAO|nr:SPOR domain-containing protein [Flavobacterium akiainvivens]KOS07658.1 sporulation protein [Flavobacterium akiainvivens]SFQ23679.1 Sporulation related domain-containing protein [Flavobacterium akiainvivens]